MQVSHSRKSSWRAGSCLALIFSLGAALSVSTRAEAGGNAAAGEARSLACQACHIPSNPATSEVPRLVGQRAGYLARQLKAFRSGDRKHDLMSAIAAQLSDADIADLAAYWSAAPQDADAKLSPAAQAIRTSKMTFPATFPAGYVMYRTEASVEDKAVSRSYANAAAVAAAKKGKPLPEGSVIVVVNHDLKLDAAGQPVRLPDGSYDVDKVTGYAAMEARAGWGKVIPELLRNDSWHYGVFTADKKPRAEFNQAQCLACHKPKATDSYVFTLAALRDRAQGKPMLILPAPAAPAPAPGK